MAFTIDNPARISLDLANTALALPSRRIDVRSGGVDSVLAAEAAGRTRLVLNLDRLLPVHDSRVRQRRHRPDRRQRRLAGRRCGRFERRLGFAGSRTTRLAAGPRAIRGIDFRRGAGGTGRVIVRLSDPHTPASLRQLGNQIVVDFAGAEIASNLARRYDAGDFATPVSGFDVVRVGDGVRLAISATGDFEHLAYQSDDQYVVEVQPARKAAAKIEDKRVYTGERLTLNFQDIETRAVLQLLADASGQNIVVSDSVQGSVTLRLQNVPWDQALDIVLRTKGLDKRRNDNVIIVAPTEELASREKAELAAHADVQDLAPLRSEYLQVNYAKASDLAALIKSQGGSGGGLLSKRGTVSVDERTNTLLLQDSADRLDDIRRLVGTLDIPIRQVQIEARIVIVSDDFSRELGVRAGFSGFDTYGSGTGLGYTSGSALANDVALEDILERTPSAATAPNAAAVRGSRGWRHGPAALQRESARRQSRRQPRVHAAGCGLPGRPRNLRCAGRRPRRSHLDAACHHGQSARSQHRAGCRNSVPGIRVFGRHDHLSSRRPCSRSRSRRRSRLTIASFSTSTSRRTAWAR